MTQESNHHRIDPDLEVRITALVLGEASELEREVLNRLIAEDPQLAALKEELEGVHRLMQEVNTDEMVANDVDWKLPSEKRTRVLSAIDGPSEPVVQPTVVRHPMSKRSLGGLTRIAALFGVVGFFGLVTIAALTNVQLASHRMTQVTTTEEAEPPLLSVDSLWDLPSDGVVAEHEAVANEDAVPATADVDSERDYRGNPKSSLLAIEESLRNDADAPQSFSLQDEVQYLPSTPNFAPNSRRSGSANADQPAASEGRPSRQLKEFFFSEAETVESEGLVPAETPPADVALSREALGLEGLHDSAGTKDRVSSRSDRAEVAGMTPRFGVAPSDSPSSGSGATAGDYVERLQKERVDGEQLDISGSVAASDETSSFEQGQDKYAGGAYGIRLKGQAQKKLAEPGPMVTGPGTGGGMALPAAPQEAPFVEEEMDQEVALGEIRDPSGISTGLSDSRGQTGGFGGGGGFGGTESDDQVDSWHAIDGVAGNKAAQQQRGALSNSRELQLSLPGITDLETGLGRGESSEMAESGQQQGQNWRFESRSSDHKASAAVERKQRHVTPMLRSRGKKTTEWEDESIREEAMSDSQAAAGTWGTRVNRQWLEDLSRERALGTVPTMASGKRPAPAGLKEVDAKDEAFSTFSLHVSDVAFKLAQSALARGEWPEAAKVRIEEFVNAFDYGDPMPSANEKVACVVEQSIHPFLQQRNVLRVSMRTAAAGRASNTPLRLTFLLDNSGSMERIDRQQTVRRAFSMLTQQLKPIDQVTLITFARTPRLLADRVGGAQSKQLVELIDALPSEGGTNLEAALSLAFEKAREQQLEGAQNRIVLLTDGAVNLGNADPDRLSQMIINMRDSGIAFDAAGISAEGLNDEILEALTRKGDGRYYLLDSLESADDGFAQQIAGALRPSAKNVKVQVEFNPERVGNYKLLGFEKHRLNKEDFRNDKVDAAEMAAAEAGVAIYQFEAKPDGEGDIGSVSVRFRDLSTGQMIENRWPIPYQADAPRLDQAASSLRVATSAALFAAKLRGEPLGETVNLKTLSEMIAGLPDRDRNARRVQQFQSMISQARQLLGE